MPAIPLIIAAGSAAAGAATATGAAIATGAAAAGATVAGAVTATGAAITTGAVAAGTTVAGIAASASTIGATTALTIGGTAISVGHVVGAAVALGVSRKIFESLNDSSDYYLSDKAKEREEEKLKSTLAKERASLVDILNDEGAEVATEVERVLEQIDALQTNREYFEAIRLSLNYKLCYAEAKEDEALAKRQEKLAERLIAVRQETMELGV